MRWKLPKAKYRCVRKFAWLPVIVDHKYIWLEKYYEMQSWDRDLYERRGRGWHTDRIITHDYYLLVKADEFSCRVYYGKYFNNESED